jgi:hypothetical protein
VVLEAVMRGAFGRVTPCSLGVFLRLERVGLAAGADADTRFRIGNLIPRSGSVAVVVG